MIERYSGFLVCSCCAVGTNYWRCGRSSQQSFAPESHPRLLVGKDRRLTPRICGRPPFDYQSYSVAAEHVLHETSH